MADVTAQTQITGDTLRGAALGAGISGDDSNYTALISALLDLSSGDALRSGDTLPDENVSVGSHYLFDADETGIQYLGITVQDEDGDALSPDDADKGDLFRCTAVTGSNVTWRRAFRFGDFEVEHDGGVRKTVTTALEDTDKLVCTFTDNRTDLPPQRSVVVFQTPDDLSPTSTTTLMLAVDDGSGGYDAQRLRDLSLTNMRICDFIPETWYLAFRVGSAWVVTGPLDADRVDAFGGLPQPGKAWEGRVVRNWQTGQPWMCVNRPYTTSAPTGTFTDVTRDDLDIVHTLPESPTLDDYAIRTTDWSFWSAVHIRTNEVGWINDDAADVLEDSAETGRATIHWMGDFYDDEEALASLDHLSALASGTTYFYGSRHHGTVRRLTASTFVVAGGIAHHWVWIAAGGNLRGINARLGLPPLAQDGSDDDLFAIGPNNEIYVPELDFHQATPNTFTASDFAGSRFNGEFSSTYLRANPPTQDDVNQSRYAYDVTDEIWVTAVQYASPFMSSWIGGTQDQAPYLGAYDDAAAAASHLRRVGDTYFDRELGQVRVVDTFTEGSARFTSRGWYRVGDHTALGTDLAELAGDLTNTEQADIQDKLGIEKGFRSTVIGTRTDALSFMGNSDDQDYKSTGITLPDDIRDSDWILIRINHGQYHWIHGDELSVTVAADGDDVEDANTITSYFETFGGSGRIIFWGKTADDELLVAVDLISTSETVTFDLIEVRRVVEFATEPSAERIVNEGGIQFSTVAGNVSRFSSFELERVLTEEDDDKLFVGDVRFEESTDGRDRGADRSGLMPIRAQRIRALYEHPVPDRGDDGGNYTPNQDWGGCVRLATTRNRRAASTHVDAIALHYSGAFISYVDGAINAGATELVLDSVSGVEAGQTLIVTEDGASNKFTEFLLVESVDTGTRTITVARNQTGTYVESGSRNIPNNVPIYLHDGLTFHAVNPEAIASPEQHNNDLPDNWGEFDAWLYSYGDDPYGITEVDYAGDTLTLTRRDGSDLTTTITTSQQQMQEGVAAINDSLVQITLWIEVGENIEPAGPDVIWHPGLGEWKNSAGTGDPVWGNWRAGRSDANAAGSGGVFWTARRQVRVEWNADDELWVIHLTSWETMPAFDTQYSEDGESWHEAQASDDVFIRMRDDNGRWVTWNIGDTRETEWELIRDWMNAYAGSTGTVVQHNGDLDLSPFEQLRVTVEPFDNWSSGEPTGRAQSYSDIIWRDDRGYLTVDKGVNSNDWNSWGDYNVVFDGVNGFVRVIPKRKDDSDYATSRPDHKREDDGTPIRTSFMMRFKHDHPAIGDDDIVGVWFFGFQVAYDRCRVRIHGKRGG